MNPSERFPFLFGTQYYRAPTPDPEYWENDLSNIQDLGFNAVKFFVQWRWSHRAPDRFYFDDLDRLMDLAGKRGLGVTLNFILDVSPIWLFDLYPDARPIDIRGLTIEPYAVGHRQIGGHPGPCYNHPGALAERQKFVATAVEHFRGYPALQMWDVWNEPELCFPQRTPDLATLACYCPHCAQGFRDWVKAKYGSLDRLNAVWGRCYETWQSVELPRSTGTITDFIDWREFHLDTMSQEASWRLDIVKQVDPGHVRYLHVVPNSYFSAVTCADDFAMAEDCEVFAATMTGGPTACMHVLSAGRGKVCYNVESHINHGCTDVHQPVVDIKQLLHDLLPQLGMGIKGVLFWQYRSEVLGFEAPAWGLVKTDGSPRPVTAAVRQFWATLKPYAGELRKAFPRRAEIGLWRSRKNEIFHFCLQGQVTTFNKALDTYIQALYWNNLPFTLVNDRMLANGELSGIKLLIMPKCYYVTQEEAQSLDLWVKAGGILLCEAHLAGYNATTGRHSQMIPGCGLANSWGFHEEDSTSPFYLRLDERDEIETAGLPDDVRKALKEFGSTGGQYFPIVLEGGALVWGAHRYAELSGDHLEALGRFSRSCIIMARQAVGEGVVFYCGTDLSEAAAGKDSSGLETILRMASKEAAVECTGGIDPEFAGKIHLDILYDGTAARFAVLINRTKQEQTIPLPGQGHWHGLFSGIDLNLTGEATASIPGDFEDIFRITSG